MMMMMKEERRKEVALYWCQKRAVHFLNCYWNKIENRSSVQSLPLVAVTVD
jgi:hypothetical protein